MPAGIPTGRTMHPHHLEPQPACRSGLDDALAGLGAGVLVVDGGGQVTFANPQAAAFFAPIQPIGLDLRSLFGLSGVSGGSAIALQADVSVESDVVRLFETCEARLGRLTPIEFEAIMTLQVALAA